MKIDRQIGIITALQQRGKVTAPWLARRFEVSPRTIRRDVDDLCRAGIPIVSAQGGGGGFSLMEGYCLDTTVFTREELQSVSAGLSTLASVSIAPVAGLLAQKLPSGGDASLRIDLSSFSKDVLSQKLRRLKAAIEERRMIRFHYYYEKGEADKRVEPYLLVFQWSDWYLFGHCTARQDFRLYKLQRLWDLAVEDGFFAPRPVPEEKTHFGSHLKDDSMISALFAPCVKYRLVEEYGPDCFTVAEDGRLLATVGFSSMDHALRWFLSFGGQVQVLSPPEMREMLVQCARQISDLYL